MEKLKQEKKKLSKKKLEQVAIKHAFYTVTAGDYGKVKDLIIDRLELLNILKNEGFYRYDINISTGAYIFIQIKNSVVQEVSLTQIRDFWFKYLENLDDYTHIFIQTDGDGNQKEVIVTKEILINKFLGSIGQYLSEQILDRLTPAETIEFNKDTKTEKYVYYKNGFATITKKEIKFTEDYTTLKNHIWSTQILGRDYNTNLTVADKYEGYFYKFSWNISNKNTQRFTALQTIIGYLLHDYLDYKLKAPIFTDAFLGQDGEANGRTGKGVFALGLKYMQNDFNNVLADGYTSINGKNFDVRDKHRYSDAGINTKTIHIEDVKAYTNIEDFFNDITEGIMVDKKNDKPFRIFSKLFFSTNKTLKIEGGSAKDRTEMYEFADHYSSEFSPQDEFKHWFFKEWDVLEWQRFDLLMCSSIQEFFKAGKIITAETINLGRRTLIDHTSREFIGFMDFFGFDSEDESKNNPKIGFYLTSGETKKEHKKKELFEQFILSYPDYGKRKGFSQARFTKWIKLYAQNSDTIQEITEFDERRSNNIDYITFKLK